MRIGAQLATGLVLAISIVSAAAGESSCKGEVFGDYYWVITADQQEVIFPEQRNAFQFRRIYFSYEKEMTENFTTHYRLEAVDPGFGKGEKLAPTINRAYLTWRRELTLEIGLVGTPTWSIAEKVWGYRPIERLILDLNKLGTANDIGVALKGKAGRLAYHLMVGNGRGSLPEDDHGKKFYSQLAFQPAARFILVGYLDFEMAPNDQHQMLMKGLVGLEQKWFNGGAEIFRRIDRKTRRDGGNRTISGLSVFGSVHLSDQWKGFGRIDVVDDDDRNTTDLLFIVGLDKRLGANVHLLPNIYLKMPDGPDPNGQARLTLHYKF